MGNIPEELYDEFLVEYKEQHKRQTEEIRQALSSKNLLLIREAAHSLSGTSGNLRLYPIHYAAKALEISARDAAPLEAISKNFKALEDISLEYWR